MVNKSFMRKLSAGPLLMDGAMGTLLRARLGSQVPVEVWNVNSRGRKVVASVHARYLQAGAKVIFTNTFGANMARIHEPALQSKIETMNRAGVQIAKKVALPHKAYVAADVGPSGLVEGDVTKPLRDTLKAVFKKQMKALAKEKPDVFVLETFSCLDELLIALSVCRSIWNGAILVHMTFQKNGKALDGTSPHKFVEASQKRGASVVGANCSFGSKFLLPVAKAVLSKADVPVSIKPSLGIPVVRSGKPVFPESPQIFLRNMKKFLKMGVSAVGGCCGVTPHMIRILSKEMTKMSARLPKR